MKLETFFEKFDQFADAPDAVAKMRELILESAIRGMLVPHNASDEPASELLKRMARVQVGQVLKQAALPPVGDDAYLQVPPGWAWTRLGNTGRIFNGDSVSESGKAELAKVEDGLPFIATKDVGYGRAALVYDNGLKVPLRDPRFKVARANAVLICAEGGSAGRKIGITDRDICFGNKLYANEVSAGIHHRYIFYVYQAPTFFREFAARMTGIIGGIARSEFRSLPIPLPPEKEQKRIVAKVDELMALCDRLEAQQQERETRHAALARASLARFALNSQPSTLNFLFHPSYAIPPADLRKSILTLAVQGKLVPQDPKDTPASELLASDAKLPDGHIRRRKIMKRAPIASKAEMFPDLPPSWEYAAVQTLYDLNMIVDYADGNHGSLYPRSSEFGDSGVTFVTARDITNGRVSWKDCARLNEDRAHQLTKGWARGGDVLLTHNATVGRVARVEREVGKFLLGTSATFYRLNEAFIDPSYFYHVLCSPTWQGQLEAIMEQTTRNQVSIQKQAYFQVPIPPLAEQRRIVAKVDQLMALVDALETQLAAARATAANLLSALVAELTGTPYNGKVSVPSASTTGRRGRPRKL